VTLGEALSDAERELSAAGIDTARNDAELIACRALGLPRAELALMRRRDLLGSELESISALVERRAGREPLAYVLGEWGFRRLVLAVDARVLVPRPETEIVVERCLALIAPLPDPDVLDAGTGSGAIALAIAQEHPGARVTAIDVSADALEVARANAQANALAVELVQADLASGFEPSAWDLVVSNPPYVSEEELIRLDPEVRDWEPRIALVDSGQTEAVARAALTGLRPGGRLVLEAADGRVGEVAALLARLGYREVSVTKDLTGRERVVEGAR
jgi:release factor glutamine methyltransferase